MKKSILKLGNIIKKVDQKKINGGGLGTCYQKGVMCCRETSIPELNPFCEPGRCTIYGSCFYY
ncbi:hypothetical protein ACSIGC_08880 [Tenacibaculum sp. ZS6-P6]|uniref:hypothetical protein n=1 Tax=Tenacibaculum sp. ZS6-P6 TaxID=3447503 RepID=UPI003F96B83E